RSDVVFGTVLFGRMEGGEGADRVLGMFINTLPVRMKIADESVESSAHRMHVLLADLMRHEHASLAMAQRCSAVPAPAPLFSSLLNYRHSSKPAERRGRSTRAWEGITGIYGEERTNYPLTLSIDDRGEGFALTAQVQEPVEPKRVCTFMHTALERLVEALEERPSAAVKTIDILPAEERSRVIDDFNATDAPFPAEACIHELFEEQVLRTPDAEAVRFEGRSLTYAELNARANQLAHYLRSLGVRPETRVAISIERSAEMVIGLLAILKAGGAYVPLDPSYPADRLRAMLEDCAPVVSLTQKSFETAEWADQPRTNPERNGLSATSPAYVIYTSGSTGVPKGVINEHRGVVNRLVWMQDAYRLEQGDAVLQKTPFSFDVSVWEFFWPLQVGARLVMARPDGHKDPQYLIETITNEAISTMHFVPSMLEVFVEAEGVERCTSLKRVVCSGEALPPALVRRFFERLPRTALVNLYGPTEAAVDVTAWTCTAENAAVRVPIGRPIANTRIYITDGNGDPVPVGVTGEICIGGVQVARGYLNRAELTAERFVEDRFAGRPGARMYRTGDVGRWLSDGAVEYVGRNDDQVKLRGMRIELGEIEARLAEHGNVREAVVVARQADGGEKRLVAYYVAEEPIDVEELRAHLSARLPEYMVPAAYMPLESMPLTGNGKLDRKRLPAPEASAYARAEYEAPVGEIEIALAEIWAEVLPVERVGRHDNFFELGGHSLLAVTLIERMRRKGLHADVRALFASPTIAQLAAEVGSETQQIEVPANAIPLNAEAITPEMLPLVTLEQSEIDSIVSAVPGGAANVQDIYPLAPLQEGILFHHLMEREGDTYLLSSLLAFDTRERLDAFTSALQAVVDRHDILRTAVMWEGLAQPVQVVCRTARLPVEEVTAESAEQLYEEFNPRRHRIDIRRAPLMRLVIAKDAKGQWLMLLLLHHLAGDHSTMEVLQREVEVFLSGKGSELPAPLPFRNFVAQARRGVSAEEHEAFFAKMLGDVAEP
ncbi:MAG TPA: amino acid adenylation domain-containing protein, partial [Thermoanaerobaculia bacterium]|nr:amino acid adenylation domain-containing protein [Thermoanaerobaculia bacterium]